MAETKAPWWVIHDDTLREALENVEQGTPAEVAYVELLAGVEKREPADEGDNPLGNP